jgi:integrase
MTRERKLPQLITAATLKAAFRDQRKGKTYDVSDSRGNGLQLRVKPTSVRWSARVMLLGNQKRYDLGPAVEGDESVGRLSLTGARTLAMRVSEMARKDQNPASFLAAFASGVSVETHLKREAARPKPSWTWQKAKEEFLADVKRSRREDTHRDYRGKLRVPELSRFDNRMVNTITRNDVAAAIADVHARGAEAMAEGMVRVIKRFWSWLAEAVRQDTTNVQDGVMTKLQAPERTRVEIGEEAFDPDNELGDAPPEIEIGRALVIARLRYFPERISLGIELLIGTCQRRRAVTGAHRMRFRKYLEVVGEEAWYVPPYFRKSGTKRGNRSHLVPCIGFAAHAVDRLDRLSDFEGSNGWLFPAAKRTKSDRGHAEAGLFNDYFSSMPRVNFSPHAVRYALATYGERDLGFRPGEAALILDHLEGVEPNDVTGQFYSSDPQIGRKREMMRAWVNWCDKWAARAIAADPLLLDREYMLEMIYRTRYGDERLERRIEVRKKLGMPLWGTATNATIGLSEAAE